jgi:ABC-type spermidine/putrescine transport system permease subunit I
MVFADDSPTVVDLANQNLQATVVTSQVNSPDHAHILLLVMSLAYAYTLTLGTLVLTYPPAFRAIARSGKRIHYFLFSARFTPVLLSQCPSFWFDPRVTGSGD